MFTVAWHQLRNGAAARTALPLITAVNLSPWVEPRATSTVEAGGPTNTIPIQSLVDGHAVRR